MVTADAGIDGRIGLPFATGVEAKIGALDIKVESYRREPQSTFLPSSGNTLDTLLSR
jgi:hypothetical protein